MPKRNSAPSAIGDVLQLVREVGTVAGLVIGQVQSASQRRRRVQRGLERTALPGVEQHVAHAQFAEQRTRGGRGLDFGFGAEQLQVSGRLFIVHRVLRAQRAQLTLAVERESLHAGAVATVALELALTEPAP